MSLRIDTAEWISGALVVGNTGLGVLGSTIPASGDNGPGFAYNDLAPADAMHEIRVLVTTWPTAGTLFVYEDTSFTYTGPADGTYTFQYQLYVDGAQVGSPQTVYMSIGSANGAAAGMPANFSLTTLTASAVGTHPTTSGSLSPDDINAIADAVWARLVGARTAGAHLQAIAAVMLGHTSGAGTTRMRFIDGSVVVDAEVPAPGEVGDRINVVVNGV